MIKKLPLILICLLAVLLQATAQKSIPKPNPPRLVVDNANLLSPEQQNILEHKLVALDDSTTNQIVILTVKTLNDESIEDVAVNTFRDWGIGDKKSRNGVLVLVAVDDRKIRIEVGYGLEGAIPDITANNIIESDIKPAFRESNYYHGLDKAIDDISKAAVGEYKVQRQRSNQGEEERGSGIGGLIKFILIIIVVLFIIAVGRGGGGGGGLIAPLLLGSMLSNSSRSDSGSWGGFGGGDSGGGDSGGGGDFGGFGGGDSGGGGASGSW